MTAPEQQTGAEATGSSKLVRWAIWVAIGALIAAAIVSVVWVLVGSQNGIVGRAFLTILLLAGFAGVAILDAHLADRRPVWFALASMGSWIIALLIGAFLTWMPERADSYRFEGITRVFSFLLIVLVLQLALLHIRLYVKALQRKPTTFNKAVGYTTVGLVILLAVLLVLPLMLHEWVEFHEIYWRIVVAVTILAALGTALVPLVNVLFAPKKQRPVSSAPGWPTYVDGVTPLPVLPDGSPDWNAYYTGYPTGYVPAPQQSVSQTADAAYAPTPHAQGGPVITPPEPQGWTPPAQPAQPAQPEQSAPYDGFPPPPPLPPQQPQQ
jgi:MFS family permease